MSTYEATKRTNSARSGTVNINKMFAALTALGMSWHSRAAIAAQLGQLALNRSDLAAIDRLVEAGRIEARQVASAQTPMLLRWDYRIIEEGNTAEPTATDGQAS